MAYYILPSRVPEPSSSRLVRAETLKTTSGILSLQDIPEDNIRDRDDYVAYGGKNKQCDPDPNRVTQMSLFS